MAIAYLILFEYLTTDSLVCLFDSLFKKTKLYSDPLLLRAFNGFNKNLKNHFYHDSSDAAPPFSLRVTANSETASLLSSSHRRRSSCPRHPSAAEPTQLLPSRCSRQRWWSCSSRRRWSSSSRRHCRDVVAVAPPTLCALVRQMIRNE